MKLYIGFLLLVFVAISSTLSEASNGTNNIEATWFSKIDGIFAKAEYIDINKTDRLYVRYGPISDSGVELEYSSSGKAKWRVHAKPYSGARQSLYEHRVSVYIKKQVIMLFSHGSFGSFWEERDLSDGTLMKRKSKKAKSVSNKRLEDTDANAPNPQP